MTLLPVPPGVTPTSLQSCSPAVRATETVRRSTSAGPFRRKSHVDKTRRTSSSSKRGLGQLRTRAAIRGGAVDEVVEIDHSLVEKQVEYMCLVFGEGRQIGRRLSRSRRPGTVQSAEQRAYKGRRLVPEPFPRGPLSGPGEGRFELFPMLVAFGRESNGTDSGEFYRHVVRFSRK